MNTKKQTPVSFAAAFAILLVVFFANSASAVDFATRCAGANVVRCVGFDQASDIAGVYGDVSGTLPGDANPEIDSSVAASGDGSLLLTIPPNSPANSSGAYFINFSDDLSVQFGAGETFYVQWRQRFSPEFLSTVFSGGGGWKQVIMGTGDKPGCSASTSSNCYSSCTALELVVQNTDQRGFAQMYNSCTGSDSHVAYHPFTERFGASDFLLQNARTAPYCLYSQDSSTRFPPSGNCFGYFPNEWMTFQVGVTLGQRVGNEFTDSHIQLWIAREGEPSELVFDWGPYNLSAGSQSENQEYGKVWLLNYHTGKNTAQSHPVGYSWYDELIVSTAKIPDPGGLPGDYPTPPDVTP